MDYFTITTPCGADYITCPRCKKWLGEEDYDEEDYEMSTCPDCKLCFQAGHVKESWGCTSDVYYPQVYVKKGTTNELLHYDKKEGKKRLTKKERVDQYDEVCLCPSCFSQKPK